MIRICPPPCSAQSLETPFSPASEPDQETLLLPPLLLLLMLLLSVICLRVSAQSCY